MTGEEKVFENIRLSTKLFEKIRFSSNQTKSRFIILLENYISTRGNDCYQAVKSF